MGFFSKDCKGCGRSVRSTFATTAASRWMVDTTVLLPGGELLQGEYDGYGRLAIGEGDGVPVIGFTEKQLEDGTWSSMADTIPSEVWHTVCWMKAGSPIEYTGPSEDSADQGYFTSSNPRRPGGLFIACGLTDGCVRGSGHKGDCRGVTHDDDEPAALVFTYAPASADEPDPLLIFGDLQLAHLDCSQALATVTADELRGMARLLLLAADDRS